MVERLNKTTSQVYGEIVGKDCYKMNDWPNNFFDIILDIGANVGVFTIYAHMRHPKATIYAYEPCKETYQRLLQNTWYLKEVNCFNEALGDGEPLIICDTGWPACNLFLKKEEAKPETSANEYSVPSRTLIQIFKDCKVGQKYCVKIDCEGGERFILDNKETIDLIKKVHSFSVEVHFPPKIDSPHRFSSFPTWERYNSWIHDNFEKTHDILYYMSDGKKRGAGLYVLKLKV